MRSVIDTSKLDFFFSSFLIARFRARDIPSHFYLPLISYRDGTSKGTSSLRKLVQSVTLRTSVLTKVFLGINYHPRTYREIATSSRLWLLFSKPFQFINHLTVRIYRSIYLSTSLLLKLGRLSISSSFTQSEGPLGRGISRS
jgi:hypothetical protein